MSPLCALRFNERKILKGRFPEELALEARNLREKNLLVGLWIRMWEGSDLFQGVWLVKRKVVRPPRNRDH